MSSPVMTCTGQGFDPLVFDASHRGYFHFDKFEGLVKVHEFLLFLWCETVFSVVRKPLRVE